MMNIRAYIAEFVGTFLLTLVVIASVRIGLSVPTAILAGMTLGFLVYAIGPISGAHVNPAVTLALASIRKISVSDAALYVVAQCIGAFLASLAPLSIGYMKLQEPLDRFGIFVAEGIGTAFLALAVCSVVLGKTQKEASGLTIGTALALGALVASTVSNGVINPAVALGIGSLSSAYVLGPIVGAILAMQAYRWLAKE